MTEKTGSVLRGETVVDVQKIISLENTINLKDQMIGSQKEQISHLKEEMKKKEQDHQKELEKAQKEVIVRKVSGSGSEKVKCTCGEIYNYSRGQCPWCGSPANASKVIGGTSVTYKNLDDVIEDIRKEESKALKVEVHELEQKALDSKLQLDKLINDKTRLEGKIKDLKENQAEELTSARSEVRERYQKEVDRLEKRIKGLIEEIKQVKEDKTDELIEQNRKQEIVELKEHIAELENEIEELKNAAVKFRPKAWIEKKRKERLEKEAIAERADKKERLRKFSKDYPSEKNWWNRIETIWGEFWQPFTNSSTSF